MTSGSINADFSRGKNDIFIGVKGIGVICNLIRKLLSFLHSPMSDNNVERYKKGVESGWWDLCINGDKSE